VFKKGLRLFKNLLVTSSSVISLKHSKDFWDPFNYDANIVTIFVNVDYMFWTGNFLMTHLSVGYKCPL